MVKNRLVFSMVVTMLTIIIIGLVAVIIYFKLDGESDKQTINDVVASSWETKEITTNTNDDQFIRIQFQIQLNNKKAKKEIEKRDFQVYDIIYSELTSMKAEEFVVNEKLAQFERSVINEINQILEDGEVTQIYTIQKIIQ
ncbi:flagellar basal body-associated FliL family protein [Pueribacillus sp. YX66]|uniref:flagellar basal body-associated FliL family protein n=1 Tax=Pueribacillus sp. YX66 TaxID=3229242 RepID=UPI00358D7B3E